jgi:hypothetical protein
MVKDLEGSFGGLLKVLSQNFAGRTDGKHENPQSRLPVSWPRFEPNIFIATSGQICKANNSE